MNILTTRPDQQVNNLQQRLQRLGHHVINAPVMRIERLACSDPIASGNDPAYVFVTSANAIHSIAATLREQCDHVTVICMGPATAAQARNAGCTQVLTTPPPYGTTALLGSKLLDTIAKDANIVVCTGEQCGQQLLDALNRKFTNVRALYTYRRLPAMSSLTQHLQPQQRDAVDLIITTSHDGLDCLWSMTPPDWQPWLRDTPLLIISNRMEQLAQNRQHRCTIRAANATDEAIIAAVKKHAQAL